MSARYKNPGSLILLDRKKVHFVLDRAQQIIEAQPMFLRLHSPVTIGTDVHGQYYDLLRFMKDAGMPPQTNYLFLGDYVDRGHQSIETMCLLLALKVKYPENVFLLRGNHECQSISRVYGFYEECRRRYSIQMWNRFVKLFDVMPASALIEDKILCMHGGLSPQLKRLNQIDKIERPQPVPEYGLFCDLLWSDPAPAPQGAQHFKKASQRGYVKNDRGTSVMFAAHIVEDFVERHELDLIVRGHQVMDDGYEFFANRKLVTIFSAPNYCGEFDNDGSMLMVKEDLKCSFLKLCPEEKQSFAKPWKNNKFKPFNSGRKSPRKMPI